VNTLSLGTPANQTLAGGAAGLLSTPRSYAVFLRAFVEGGLLGPQAQAALNSSYLYLPDYSLPEVNAYMGFSLLKDEYRGWPGLPDHDFLSHAGQLPGARCSNGAVVRIDGAVGPIHGALCINTLLQAYPGGQVLWLKMVDRILIPENFGGQ
jgi:CubicO group peptidase (beta-lactamase class C family)